MLAIHPGRLSQAALWASLAETPPTRPASSRSAHNWTTVNLRKFGRVADDVHARLIQLMQNNELEIALEGGVEGLRLYSFGTQVM